MYSARLLGKQMDVVYGLYLPEYSVPTPAVQTNYVEIPGMDGSLDKTAPDGVVRYKDREWSLQFQHTGPCVSGYDLPSISRRLYSDLHGRDGEIIFDDDRNYKWLGRVFVDDVRCENNGLIVADVRLITRPYRYGVVGIRKQVTLGQSLQDVVLVNGHKPLIPTIIVTGDNAEAHLEFEIKDEAYVSDLTAGTWTVPGLILFEGATHVNVSGSGAVCFEYQEVVL